MKSIRRIWWDNVMYRDGSTHPTHVTWYKMWVRTPRELIFDQERFYDYWRMYVRDPES